MEMTLRPATHQERLYTRTQSKQIMEQTGSIGYLSGSLGYSKAMLPSSCETYSPSRNTPEFKAEFNSVLDMLRFDERYGGILKDVSIMAAYCRSQPQSSYDGATYREYAFRADTEQHSYLLRCIPDRDEGNIWIYPYQRQLFESHMKQSEKGIRFISSDYKEKLRLADGDVVRIVTKGGEYRDRTVRYIDEYHMELHHVNGSNLYHICEFAEHFERNECQALIPLRRSLPEHCYSCLSDTGEIIILKRGETGYYKTDIHCAGKGDAKEISNGYNFKLGVSKAQEAAMLAGSMFGFDVPAADPAKYDKDGKPIKSKHMERGDAR